MTDWLRGEAETSRERVRVNVDAIETIMIDPVNHAMDGSPGVVNVRTASEAFRLRKTDELRAQLQSLLGETLSTYRDGKDW